MTTIDDCLNLGPHGTLPRSSLIRRLAVCVGLGWPGDDRPEEAVIRTASRPRKLLLGRVSDLGGLTPMNHLSWGIELTRDARRNQSGVAVCQPEFGSAAT